MDYLKPATRCAVTKTATAAMDNENAQLKTRLLAALSELEKEKAARRACEQTLLLGEARSAALMRHRAKSGWWCGPRAWHLWS